MDVVLWDTHEPDVVKEAAGGFGAASRPPLGGPRGLVLHYLIGRDRPPAAMIFPLLAAIFRRLGHQVRYVVDRLEGGADLYVFCPSLITLDRERRAISRLLAQAPGARMLVVGPVASVLPGAFEGLNVTVVKGEAEQLLWKLDDVLERPGTAVQLGLLEDLDRLPPPDWSLFHPGRFRLPGEFWKFPTASVEHSRGCRAGCDYCPATVLDDGVRFRDPRLVAEEIRYASRRWGFRSFKFRDPTFGLDRAQVFQLAEHLGRLDQPVQFSIETRADLMRPEMLRVLKRVGLTCVTLGVDALDTEFMERHGRPAIEPEQHRDLVALCRGLGIRTAATFMIGFPGQSEDSVLASLQAAESINPTFALFYLVTPYPGTPLAKEYQDRIADPDWAHYSRYRPVLAGEAISRERLGTLVQTSLHRYYFRWAYWRENAHLLWPGLRRWGLGRERRVPPHGQAPHDGPPRPASGLDILRRRYGLRQDGPHARGK